jgi:hypothetical protein
LVIGRVDGIRSASLDPSPPTSHTHRRPLGVGVLSVAWVLAATWLQLVRGPGHRAPDVIWAEDGGVFLNQAMRHSLWHNLVVPHAGYLQVIARLLTQPVAHLPLSWVAIWLAVSAAIVVALISLVVWFASAGVVQSLWARLLLTALVPVLPQAGFEVNAAVCDVHWYLIYAAFWVLLAAPSSWRGQLGASAVVVLAALSDPLTALVLPAAAPGLMRAPRRNLALMAPMALCSALALQIWVHLTRAVSYRSSPTTLSDLPTIYGLRVVLSAVTGDRMLGLVYIALGLPIVAATGLLAVIGLAALMRQADRTAQLVAAVCLAISVALLFVTLGLRGTSGIVDRDQFTLNGSRYTIMPLLMLWTAVLILLDRLEIRRHAGPAGPAMAVSGVGIVTTAFLGMQVLSDWGGNTVRLAGPSWSADLRTAAATCQQPPGRRAVQPIPLVGEVQGKGSAPVVPGPDDVTIVVAPQPPPGQPLLFAVVIPCASVRSDAPGHP